MPPSGQWIWRKHYPERYDLDDPEVYTAAFERESHRKKSGGESERAFYFSDFAANIWVETKENNIERHVRKAEYLLWHVQAMDEDKCGEKLAILKDLIGIKHTPATQLRRALRLDHYILIILL